ncbi:MAG: glycosyltransferase family 2 protein [Bdellovibrionales bacterium]|nr:glycosyltransferase family 2 protein [Bdellovibrionales bacterium]
MRISIIIPTFNEEACIEECVRRVALACPKAEILVVDGGWDQTSNRVRRLQGKQFDLNFVKNQDDRGKGHAVRTGIALAKGDILVQFDADLQFSPEDLPKLINPIIEGDADMVLGSRFLKSNFRNSGSPIRSIGNWFFSAFVSKMFNHEFTDILAGCKAWRRMILPEGCPKSDNYSYEIELPVTALQRGARIIDVPVVTSPRLTGTSSVRAFSVGLQLLVDVFKFRFSNSYK